MPRARLRLRAPLLVLFLAGLLGGGAGAEPRDFEASLRIVIDALPEVTAQGSGVAEVDPVSGAFTLPAGVLQFSAVLPGTPWACLESLALGTPNNPFLVNAIGSFDPAASSLALSMPLVGVALFQFCNLFATGTTTLPFSFVGGVPPGFTTGFTFTSTPASSTGLALISGRGFTTGVVNLVTGEAIFTDGTTLSTNVVGAVTGSDSRTPAWGGSMRFVTPIVIAAGTFADGFPIPTGFAELSLTFAPEPGPLLLGLAALGTLAGLGRRRRRG
jgi:hypothetical protein